MTEQPCGCPDGADVATDDLLSSATFLAHQLGPLEHRHVLLDRGEAHVVVAGEDRDRRLLLEHPRDDVATGGVGEGREDPVDVLRSQLMYNHEVVRYSGRRPAQ